MSKLIALIFDVDGTIAETERDGHRVAFNQAFAEAGLDWQWSEEFYGKLLHVPGGKERMQHYWDEYEPQFDPAGADRDWLLHVHDRKNYFYKQRVEQGEIPLRPGVKRLIEAARSQDIKLAIATTSAVPNAMALIERSFDPDWFEVIAAGEMVDNKKPAPDVYLHALEVLNLEPEQCFAFEDSGAGLKAAIAAKLCTVVTQNEYTQNHDFAGACRVLNHLGDPEQPVTVVQGEPLEGDYFTLDNARSLLENA